MAVTSSTLAASGKAAAPGAGAAVATLTTPAAGSYAVRVWVGLAGTLAAITDANNVTVTAGAVSVTLGIPGAAGHYGPFEFQATLDGSTSVVVSATGAATASSEYSATVLAEPISVGKNVTL